MKSPIPFPLLMLSMLAFTGCLSGPGARQGGTIGALVGAPVGAVIGSQNGEAGAGALIGGTLGALAGNNIGASFDAERQASFNQPVANAGGLAIQDVLTMSQNGLGEDVIITQIQSQGIQRRPSPQDLIAMKNAGVSDRLIQAMQTSPVAGPSSPPAVSRPVIVEEHYWGPGYFPYRHHPRYCAPPRRRHRGTSISFSHRF